MCSPIVAVAPDAVFVAVEDADLAVDRSRRAPVTVGVEGDGLHQVLVPVADEVKVGALINGRRRRRIRGHIARHARWWCAQGAIMRASRGTWFVDVEGNAPSAGATRDGVGRLEIQLEIVGVYSGDPWAQALPFRCVSWSLFPRSLGRGSWGSFLVRESLTS